MEYINPAEMRAVDINSAYLGFSPKLLMENAGRAVYEELSKIEGFKEKRITFLCGTGNNGGDGFVAAKFLVKKGRKPAVYLVGKRNRVSTDAAREALSELEGKGVKVKEIEEAGAINFKSDIIVDALLGTGVIGEPREPMKEIIKQVNSSRAFKLSVDVPSGMGSKTVVKADLVVSLHMAKKGLENYNTVVKDIGIPYKARSHVGPGDLSVNLKRKAASHKGENGRVIVIGGSAEYHGAPILAGLGALNAGCDLVTLLVPESILDAARAYKPDFVVRSYEGEHLNSSALKELAKYSPEQDVCIIGPGLGTSGETKKALNNMLARIKIPVVLDADALKQLDIRVLKKINSVITPSR
jgi:NAD(P)H-hydrate epimerase